MNEFIALIGEYLPSVGSSIVIAVCNAFIAICFLRKNTGTEEFEKIKCGKFGEITDILLEKRELTYSEYLRSKNFVEIAKKADAYYDKLENKENVNNGNYEFDWFLRFYDCASAISNEDMQNIWAGILAQEINKAGTFSYKTLDVLHNLQKKDAELFAKICKYCLCSNVGWFLPENREYWEKCGIGYGEIMKLYEFGLIYKDPFIYLGVEFKDNENENIVITRTHELSILKTSDSKETLNIYVLPLTNAGIELYQVLNVDTNPEALSWFAMTLEQDYQVKTVIKEKIENDKQVDRS